MTSYLRPKTKPWGRAVWKKDRQASSHTKPGCCLWVAGPELEHGQRCAIESSVPGPGAEMLLLFMLSVVLGILYPLVLDVVFVNKDDGPGHVISVCETVAYLSRQRFRLV